MDSLEEFKKWRDRNLGGKMDKWAGKIMMVSRLCLFGGYEMREDSQLLWDNRVIAGKVV
jgi:hypothetical protein